MSYVLDMPGGDAYLLLQSRFVTSGDFHLDLTFTFDDVAFGYVFSDPATSLTSLQCSTNGDLRFRVNPGIYLVVQGGFATGDTINAVISRVGNTVTIEANGHVVTDTSTEEFSLGYFGVGFNASVNNYIGQFSGVWLLSGDGQPTRTYDFNASGEARTGSGQPVLIDTTSGINAGGMFMSTNDSNWVYTGAGLRAEPKENIVTGGLLVPEDEVNISTGGLLSAEAKSDIATGNLLTSEAKSDIVTGDLLTANALPATSDFPLNHARIGYDNTLAKGSASATSDNIGAAKMLTPSTYDKWRPTGDSVATLTGTYQQCNYVGIAAHNLGTDGATLTVKVSNGGAYTSVYSQLVTTNGALFIRFAAGTYSNVEITLSGSTSPEIGVVFLGLELEMMRPIFTGHKPAPLSATDAMTPQVSDGGQFLGKQIVRKGYATSADFQHLTDEWYRDKFQPFVDHAKTRPYFWAWNLLESPNDIVYGWTNDNISPSYMGIRNWLEVSFNIEAHA